MKKLILLMFAMTAIFGAIPVIAESTGQKYTCPMHPEVVMDAPGQCPKCGMTLVPMKTEKRKRPTPNPAKRDPVSNEEKMKPHENDDMARREMTMASSVNIAEPMSRE